MKAMWWTIAICSIILRGSTMMGTMEKKNKKETMKELRMVIFEEKTKN